MLHLHRVRVDKGRVAWHDINIMIIEVAQDPTLVVMYEFIFLPQEIANGGPFFHVNVDTPQPALGNGLKYL
jgi:hypothetical protein